MTKQARDFSDARKRDCPAEQTDLLASGGQRAPLAHLACKIVGPLSTTHTPHVFEVVVNTPACKPTARLMATSVDNPRTKSIEKSVASNAISNQSLSDHISKLERPSPTSLRPAYEV